MLQTIGDKLQAYHDSGNDLQLQALYDKLKWKTNLNEDEKYFMYWWDDYGYYLDELERAHESAERYVTDWRLISTDPDAFLVVLRRKLRYSNPQEKALIENGIKIAKDIKKETREMSARKKLEIAKSKSISYIIEQHYGVEINHNKCCCLLHKEVTPSFFIYPNSNSFYCFGCNEGGDVVDLIMKKESLSFGGAIDLLIRT
jgi:hypothetical protein